MTCIRTLLFGLFVGGQVKMRRIEGWFDLVETSLRSLRRNPWLCTGKCASYSSMKFATRPPPPIAEIQVAAPSRTRHWTRVRYTSV